jgi:hypothetical protein
LIPFTALPPSRRSHGFRVRHLQPHRLADDLRKGLEVSGCRPHFQLGIAAAMQLNEDVFATVVDFEARNRLRVAAVQTLRYPKN